jgi:competence protein ComFC
LIRIGSGRLEPEYQLYEVATAKVKANPWFNALMGFFYPETCQLCGLARATPEQGFVCHNCASSAEFIHPPFCDQCGMPFDGAITGTFVCVNCKSIKLHFSSARAAVAAKDKVLEAIHRYKYQRALWLEPFLARLLVDHAQPALAGGNWDWIVPVPLHPVKEREREFNQAERLGRCLSVATGIPLQNKALRRVVQTRTQTLLTREERLDNMRRAFRLNTTAQLTGKRIILVDDVFTTGATSNSCAQTLKQGGATEVCVWTVARGV